MSATPSHLQLDSYYLKEVSYFVKDNLDVIPEPKSEKKSVGLEIIDLTTPLDDENKNWRCELTIKSSDDIDGNPFYSFKIVMVGFFSVDPNLSDEMTKLLVESNCPAVLYSTSREIIATVTRRSPYPAVLLPLVTFVKGLDEPVKNEPKPKKKRATSGEKSKN